LDLLGNIGSHRGYRQLLPDTVAIEVSPDLQVRVLTLEALIKEKARMAGEKDKAVLAVLRKTLEQRSM
jgi:hypothetical protein